MALCTDWWMALFARRIITSNWSRPMTRMTWTPGTPRQLLDRSSIHTTVWLIPCFWSCRHPQPKNWLAILLKSQFWMSMTSFQLLNWRRFWCSFKQCIKMHVTKNIIWPSWRLRSLHWRQSIPVVLASLFDGCRRQSTSSMCLSNVGRESETWFNEVVQAHWSCWQYSYRTESFSSSGWN